MVPGRPLLAGPLEVDPLLLLGGHLQAAVYAVPEGLLHSQEVLETGIITVELCLFVCHLWQLLVRSDLGPLRGQQAQEGEEVVASLPPDLLSPDVLEQVSGEDNVGREKN